MKANHEDPSFSTGDLNAITKAIPFLLAGLEGGVCEFTIFSLSLQRLPDGSFRSILRGFPADSEGPSIRLVAFTNAQFASECILSVETAFRDNLLRWHVDQFYERPSDNGSTKAKPKKLTLVKSGKK